MSVPAAVENRGSRRRRAAIGAIAFAALAIVAGNLILVRGSAHAKLEKAAREAIRTQKYEEARPILADWLAREPKSAEAHYLMARVEVAADHRQAAVNELALALAQGYPPDELSPYRGVILARSDQFDEAEALLRNGLARSDEPMPEVAQALARIYLNTFRLEQASGPIARWMKDAPDDPRPYLWRNEIDGRRDTDHAVIIQNYREALKRDPNLAEARIGLADRLRQAHRLEEAAEEYEAYLKLKPDSPDGCTGAGRVAQERGKIDEAIKYYERALKIDPNEPIALKELGIIDLNQGRREFARDRLRKVIAIDPFDPDTHFNLARALRFLGDPEGAKREDELAQKLRAEHSRMADVRAALVKKPKDLALRFETAEWMLSHARDEEGLNWSRQILHDHPGHEPTLRLLIDYYTKQKDPAHANLYRLMLQQSGKGSG